MPREDLDAVTHGRRVARMVQEASGRPENREAIDRQLAEVHAFPLRDRVELRRRDDAGMASPEDELTFGKVALREDTLALRCRVANLYIAEHGGTVLR